jgi:hypothetical protein
MGPIMILPPPASIRFAAASASGTMKYTVQQGGAPISAGRIIIPPSSHPGTPYIW